MTQDNSVTHPRQLGHTFRQLGTLSYCDRIVLNVIIVGRQLGPLSKKVSELSRQKNMSELSLRDSRRVRVVHLPTFGT